ncbi:NAD(P)-binding protein [Heliocybe sulcata]|uniref:NAD(P)-binding protein n=1 Tax=Heliocybe sulcata TaxID=5364 RepID=A0A5C3NFZ8_9AGAM|nr:NAD(P)-binding protein [Heliocybe sulcata]
MGGLFSRTTFDPNRDIPDLKGKVIIVTGGNTGIGFATIQHLVRRGAKVYMGARNESKATGAIARLKAEGMGPGFGEVHWLNLDLSDPRKAKKAAEDFAASESRLDVLVNNAALLMVPYEKTADGIQQVMMVDYLSPFVFTEALLPLLKKTSQLPGADVRIVALSSDALLLMPNDVRFRDVNDFNQNFKDTWYSSMYRYGLAKFAVCIWMKHLQKRLDAEGSSIIAMSVHPGGSNTEYGIEYLSQYHLAWLFKFIFVTPPVAAFNSAFAATSPAVRANPEKFRGAYLHPVGKVNAGNKPAQDPALREELYSTTLTILRDLGVCT